MLAAVALALQVPGPVGPALGALVAVLGPNLLARLEGRAEREEREQLAADLPLALDLLAACLAGGAPVARAVRAAATAVGGPCGQRLDHVAAGLEVGLAPAHAWSVLLAAGEVAARAGWALVRAAEGGAPVAAAVARLADEARAEEQTRREDAAARAGVLAVGPLGLCFLPAFVLLGVVPVVAGLVGPVLSGL